MTHTHGILLREFKARTQAGIEGVTWRKVAYWFAPLITHPLPGPLVQGVFLPTVGWTLLYQLVIIKTPHRQVQVRSDCDNSTIQTTSDNSWLCQVDSCS